MGVDGMTNKRIKKVKITSENKILMIYEKRSKNNGWDEYQFTCSEEARPEFYASLDALKEHVIEICELPDSYIDRIKVRGVSFSWTNDVMGATISAAMTLENSYEKLNLNTPHKISSMYNENTPDDEMQLLSSECVDCLWMLQR